MFRQNKFRAEHQGLVFEQKLLRAQMNPHFIFNSLNSIQQFVISRKNDKAETYLSKFATLVRNLLESNIKENISIYEEIEILTGYLEMESLRFSGSFTFSITVNEAVNREWQIPHMMIQPFVENAIWHGLLPKKSERVLQITFEPGSNNKTLCCTVEDNGIGRKESMSRHSTFKKKSLALSFINQRIKLLRKTLKVDCRVDIIDMTNAQDEGTGTKAIIILPLLHTV